jgi:hypothetical protein
VVVLDTDVLVLAYAFHRDARQAANTRFLESVRARQPAATIYSVMELLGKLSFNLSAERLAQWPLWLQARHSLSVLYPRTAGMTAETFFHREYVESPFAKMQQHQMPFLDALILNLAEAAPDVEAFVTWNARHFQGKTVLAVVTPAEYLGADLFQEQLL